MKPGIRHAICQLSWVLLLAACSYGAQQEPTHEPEASEPATIPVTAEALVGDWARVLTANRNPDLTAHYWLRLSAEGTFALTTNKMQFDTNVNHRGTYALDGDHITFSAQAGSQECEGQSATYQLTMYADGSLEFLTLDVPCERWLNMGAGRLGEGTIWIRLDR